MFFERSFGTPSNPHAIFFGSAAEALIPGIVEQYVGTAAIVALGNGGIVPGPDFLDEHSQYRCASFMVCGSLVGDPDIPRRLSEIAMNMVGSASVTSDRTLHIARNFIFDQISDFQKEEGTWVLGPGPYRLARYRVLPGASIDSLLDTWHNDFNQGGIIRCQVRFEGSYIPKGGVTNPIAAKAFFRHSPDSVVVEILLVDQNESQLVYSESLEPLIDAHLLANDLAARVSGFRESGLIEETPGELERMAAFKQQEELFNMAWDYGPEASIGTTPISLTGVIHGMLSGIENWQARAHRQVQNLHPDIQDAEEKAIDEAASVVRGVLERLDGSMAGQIPVPDWFHSAGLHWVSLEGEAILRVDLLLDHMEQQLRAADPGVPKIVIIDVASIAQLLGQSYDRSLFQKTLERWLRTTRRYGVSVVLIDPPMVDRQRLHQIPGLVDIDNTDFIHDDVISELYAVIGQNVADHVIYDAALAGVEHEAPEFSSLTRAGASPQHSDIIRAKDAWQIPSRYWPLIVNRIGDHVPDLCSFAGTVVLGHEYHERYGDIHWPSVELVESLPRYIATFGGGLERACEHLHALTEQVTKPVLIERLRHGVPLYGDDTADLLVDAYFECLNGQSPSEVLASPDFMPGFTRWLGIISAPIPCGWVVQSAGSYPIPIQQWSMLIEPATQHILRYRKSA